MDSSQHIHNSETMHLNDKLDSSLAVVDEKATPVCNKTKTDISSNCNDLNSTTLFSGLGEEVSYMKESANSRACILKHEKDLSDLEAVFTSDTNSDQLLELVVPVVDKIDAGCVWIIFKNAIEKRMKDLSDEKMLLDTEWLKEPAIRLAKILCYLSTKEKSILQSESQHSSFLVNKWSDVLTEILKDASDKPLVSSHKAEESNEMKEKYIYREDMVKLLSKIDELQHETVSLSDENSQIQEMLAEMGKKLRIMCQENIQLKHQLYRTKADLEEVDNLTSEVWRLKSKLRNFERTEYKKREKLLEIEDQKNILYKRVHDVEEKLEKWPAIVEVVKNELNALKSFICVQEQRVVSALQETKLTEKQLNELSQIKTELEASVKELLEVNDALRADKRILENQLTEVQCLISKNSVNQRLKGAESLEGILCEEEDSLSSQDEASSSFQDKKDVSSNIKKVSADLQKSIEVKSGSSLLPKSSVGSEDHNKSLLEEEINIQKKTSGSGKSMICHSPDVRDQINEEIRALREQLVRSQVLFTYLLKDGSSEHTPKSLDCKTHLRTLLEEGHLSDVMFQCKSFDGQVPARFYNRSNRSSSSYASHRSTPMHCGYTSQSCPTLPIESPVVTKSTQTEPMSGVTFYMRTGTNGVLSATSSNSLSKGNVFFSPPSTPCETICEPLVITDVCEVHHEPDDHSFPRHRTNSFLSAVKDGNPKLIDVTAEANEKSLQYERTAGQISGFDDNKSQYFDSSVSRMFDSEAKSVLEENRLESAASEKKTFPEKQGSTVKTSSTKQEGDSTENKEKFKTSQRSMRRGSGAGSPNSQLTIPRYPAFDFGEQEDAQSLFPSPSEPEANRNIKEEILQGMKNSELASEGDSYQNGSKLKETNQKKRDTSKSKTLMPELMENSETESAKGSFECEAPDLPPSVDAPPVPVTDIAFPSLPNTFLAKLGVHKDSPLSVEAFDEQELESKFIALSLAFKTDRTTLAKRLELHKRQRDMAEKNVENEFQAMRDHLNALNLKATRADVRELISKIQNHLDIAQQATARVSGRSETYGAVQQEERVSRAFEVLVLHVDHLKRLFDKEHKELEETRRMLTDTQVFRKDVGESVTEDQKKYLRSFGFPVGSIKSVFSLSSLLSIFRLSFKVGRRRASVAEFQTSLQATDRKSPGFNQSWTSGFGARKVEPRQRTLCPFPTASSVGLSSSSLPTSQVTSISPSRVSTASISARRCSLPTASPLVPNMLQNLEAASNSNLTLQPLQSPDKLKKKERNLWTRKLSAVTDEKEQEEEDESEYAKDDQTLNQPSSEMTKHLVISNRTCLNSEPYCEQYNTDDESPGASDSVEGENILDNTSLKTLHISSVKDIFNKGKQTVLELRQRYCPDGINVRRFCTFYSLAVVLCLLCVIILLNACIGVFSM